MVKTIAVDDRFKELIEALRERGYNVVNPYSSNSRVDACVYYEGIRDFQNHSLNQRDRVFMIDGKGKTVDDIETILQRRAYSSLF